MANLSSLIHELRERIAASSSSPPNNNGEDDPLESRFRAVLPNLLQAYVIPSSSAKEREVIAVLKLLSQTAKNFPGVFFYGKATAVLPVVGRILPFFAEPAFRSRHGVIFETVGSLLSLLRTGEREAYRQFFLDGMSVVEDLLYVASVCVDKSSIAASTRVSLRCFCESLARIAKNPALFGDLPTCCRPTDGPGILIDVTDKPRWKLFATWAIKILSKCLTDGTLYVEGLINSSFVSAACALLCYGDADLHMACFDFARIATAVMDVEFVPCEKFIRSISTILGENEKELSEFRSTVYDSSMGACLHELYSICSDDVVECTAGDIINIFPQSLQSTESPELKVAMCSAYIRIAKTCPIHVWRPESLLNMLCYSNPCLPLIDCICIVVDLLGPDLLGEGATSDCNISVSSGKANKSLKTGEKRPGQNLASMKIKRQKVDNDILVSNPNAQMGSALTCRYTCERDRDYADYMRRLLFLFVGLLKPLEDKADLLRPEVTLRALSILCIVFCNYPQTNLSLCIFQQMHLWMPWICEQAKEKSSITFDLSIYLEAVHSILLLQSSLPMENRIFRNKGDDADHIISVLKLPWTHSLAIPQAHPLWKAKCISIQIFSKIGIRLNTENDLEIFDLALHDGAEEVRVEAVLSIPMIVLWSGFDLLVHIFEKLEILVKEKHDQVNRIVPFSIGFLACLFGSSDAIDDQNGGMCKLFLSDDNVRHYKTVNHLLQGFWCPMCDKRIVQDHKQCPKVIKLSNIQSLENGLDCDFGNLQSLFFELLLNESSEEVQVACVGVIQRILMHGTKDILLKTRSQWIQCIEFLLLNRKKAVREAFCSQISWFIEGPILNCLFEDGEASNKTKEQKFLDQIKHALAVAEDPQIFETLLESTAEIMNAVDIHAQLFFFSLILLVDQLDNPHITVRIIASRLIHRSCYFHLKGGFELLLSRVFHIRNELFDYLCMRLVNRPAMVREFAEAVLSVKIEELAKKMVPVVLPKLVVTQQDNDQALVVLHELAMHLDMDLVPLVVNWLPKVLAFALLQADGRELSSALQFYQAQTGSNNQEIFAAALPALLDELVCFLGDGDSDETNRRLVRVPQMIQQVARVLTGSDDLPGFLRNHFVGLLNSIDRKMLHTEDLFLQKQALKRIEMLIEMMGSQLSTYVPKIMVLLMHAVQKEALQSKGLSVLHYFIKQLAKVSPSSTKHVVSQVFAALIPFLERNKDNPSLHLNKVVEILEELVVENRVLLKQHIRELPMLPSVPVLTEVNKVIQEARGSMTLKDQLQDMVDGLNHESLNVRYMVACELCKLLKLRWPDVAAVIAAETSSDLDVLSSLVSTLLRGCAEESRTAVGQRLKLVCADCLGALGAVDPAKVKGISCQRFKIECSDDDLIFELIHKHLARAFRAASDTIVQDSAALAIQELLKIAGCEASMDENVSASTSQAPKGKENLIIASSGSRKIDNCSEMNKRGQRLWGRFSNYIKEIIAPCLTSRFQLPKVADSTSVGPIYRPSMSFRRWIFFWIRKLTVHATGSRVSIFNACRGIVRHDMQTAMYLLPYLVLNAVCHGTEEARHGITEEILSVLNAAASENSEAAVHGITGGQNEVCMQAVFTLLDNLGQWMDDVKQEMTLSHSLPYSVSKPPSKAKVQIADPSMVPDQLLVQCNNVLELLAAIPKITLSRASFRCQAYARSLLYFESHVQVKSGSFNPAAERSGVFEDDDVSFLMEIYSNLDEPDGLSGLAHLRKSANLHDQLLINKKAGNWAEVLTSCEQALQMEPTSIQRHSDVLNCLLNMCHLQAMVTHVDGLISRIPQYKKTWCMQGVQAAWRLGRWNLMDEYLSGAEEEGLLCSSAESNASFDMDVAKVLQAMMKRDQFCVAEKIAQSKQALLAHLAAAGMDSYERAYPFVVRLHMLHELEDFHNLLVDDSFLERSFHLDDPGFSRIIKEWDNRLRLTQPSLWTRETLLAFRRLVFNASGLDPHAGNCWLQYAKLCRSAGHYETANRAILEAHTLGTPNVHMEKAKLLWSTRRSDGAIAELQQSLLNMPVDIVGSAAISSITSLSLVPLNPPSLCLTQVSNKNQDVAKTLLLYSRWIHYTGQKQKEDVINLYSKVKELQPTWEKVYFYMAKYFDDVLADARKRQEENLEPGTRITPSSSFGANINTNTERPWWSYLPDVMLNYAKGLHRGHKNLFQALPRLLTLWFDFGSKYPRVDSSSNKDLRNVHGKVMSIMRGCLKDLPTYQWLTVLSQLVSRICHQNDEIVRLVKHIITSVLREYPQQALWMMAAVSKSTVSARREAAAEIIQAAHKGSRQENSSLFVQFCSLIDHLIKLCFHGGQQKARALNISTEFSALKRMMPLGIIMPTQQALTVALQTYDTNLAEPLKIDIFSATDLPTISGIADEAEILSSLQRPKKVVFLGSDGVERPFLCKPKDDLRKDARMMEFTAMINHLLSKYPESRRRKLYIRTFAVIPLTEDCGMVEWVPHTRGLRHILQDIYIACGKFDRQKTNPLIKRIYDQCQGKIPEDEMLKTKILPMFPPVFHRWFLTTFSEPAAWFRARVAYAHTSAVWSMVGHIVGLGDRHGENILFDSTSGDCVHVDFSCLFDKGLQLEKPELVPFRLTQNMIDGLGITGYKGIFLRVCEITLSVLRTHRETLMSILETFIHDPLVEWTKSHKSSRVEVQNPHAQRAISNIEARLQGVVVGVGAAPSLPLAVEGQAQRLIAEAVSHKNLGKMYIWWMPWF
ncbi:PREDICTED: serine/threonine-protein kinase ATR isoform X2 [Nelumbo nucifera]|uniref:Serine/threonine-protein kinase ATR n=1 Tax=Nelumbo nucifera TaxID=4432 RepID=A0A1U8AH19_NELNU|nr:PREDICTED: serine/threonine-protein kinase ATR isoform X2 [Nelumbo nucifera]